MKNRILSLLMVVLICLSSVGSVCAEQTEVSGSNANLDFAIAMGIMDDGVQGGDAVTRAQLATMISRIVIGNVNTTDIANSPFADVPHSMAGNIMPAVYAGIMNGTGESSFSPDSNTTYIQLLKTVVALLGYEPSALEKGGYPGGYYNIATRLGLGIDGIPGFESTITYDGVATVLKQAINADMMLKNYGDNEAYKVAYGKNYLDHYMGISVYRGVVTGTNIADFGGEATEKFGQVKIDNKIFALNDATVDLTQHLGYRVEVYYKEGNSKPDIIWYEPCENIEIVIDSTDVDAYGNYQLSYYNDAERLANIRISKAAYVVYNGALSESYTAETLNPFKVEQTDGYIKAVDHDMDGIYDVVFVESYHSYVFSSIADDVIYTKYQPTVSIDMSEFELGKAPELLNVFGEHLTLDMLEENDIINVYYDKNGKVTKIVVTIDTYTGTLNELRQDRDGIILVVNDMEYRSSVTLATNPQMDLLKPGEKVCLYFNRNGRVSDIEVKAFDAKQVGYLVDALEISKTFSPLYKMKIFTAAGKMEIFDIADKVELTDSGDKVKPKAVIEAAGLEGNRVKRQPVLYKLNKDGEVSYLRYYDPFADGSSDGFYQYAGFDGTSSISAWHYRENSRSFGAKLLINNNTLMFSVPKENERDLEDNYLITTYDVFNDGTGNRPFEAYGTKKHNPCAEILVLKGYHQFDSVSSDADILVVDNISTVLNDEGERVMEIVGWHNGSYVTKYAEMGVFNGAMADRGDAVRLLDDKYGVIIKGEIVFDASTHTLMTSNPSNSSFYSKPRFVYGTVTYNDLEFISVRIENTSNLESYPLNKFKIVKVEYENGKVWTVSTATANQVLDELHHVGAGSKVLVHTRYGDCKTLVIYD